MKSINKHRTTLVISLAAIFFSTISAKAVILTAPELATVAGVTFLVSGAASADSKQGGGTVYKSNIKQGGTAIVFEGGDVGVIYPPSPLPEWGHISKSNLGPHLIKESKSSLMGGSYTKTQHTSEDMVRLVKNGCEDIKVCGKAPGVFSVDNQEDGYKSGFGIITWKNVGIGAAAVGLIALKAQATSTPVYDESALLQFLEELVEAQVLSSNESEVAFSEISGLVNLVIKNSQVENQLVRFAFPGIEEHSNESKLDAVKAFLDQNYGVSIASETARTLLYLSGVNVQ
ncbi:MAG TPA: vacuolating cyotoxin family protein [Pseudobdellovibrionaceae bacterium]|nr:vacuolating cyotoxin family protein [Pseudobdellovibrionaceae bacterium]